MFLYPIMIIEIEHIRLIVRFIELLIPKIKGKAIIPIGRVNINELKNK